jgi:hypothetical protein
MREGICNMDDGDEGDIAVISRWHSRLQPVPSKPHDASRFDNSLSSRMQENCCSDKVPPHAKTHANKAAWLQKSRFGPAPAPSHWRDVVVAAVAFNDHETLM